MENWEYENRDLELAGEWIDEMMSETFVTDPEVWDNDIWLSPEGKAYKFRAAVTEAAEAERALMYCLYPGEVFEAGKSLYKKGWVLLRYMPEENSFTKAGGRMNISQFVAIPFGVMGPDLMRINIHCPAPDQEKQDFSFAYADGYDLWR